MNVRPGCDECGSIVPAGFRVLCRACVAKRGFWWKAWLHFSELRWFFR